MPLTSLEIKQSSPKDTDLWLSDEKGLRLLIKPNGSKYWRMKYRFAGKQKTLALGVYPEVSLKEARLARDKARLLLAEGHDPSVEKQITKKQGEYADQQRFSILALQWYEHQKGTWDERHASRLWNRLESNTFEDMDIIPLEKIQPFDVLVTIRKIESRGALDVASRCLQDVRRVFRYGVQIGQLRHNPASDLTGVVKTYQTQHRASLPIGELGQFMNDLTHYNKRGRVLTQLAIKMLVLTFVRPSEVRGARWDEIDWDNKLWRIPAERMKMRTEHLVLLSDQVIEIIKQVEPISGQYALLFPSERDRREPISDNTMRRAIFRMGYDGETEGKSRATPHGFRANASSVLNEKGFNPDAIERQLSHMERNSVRAAYTHHARYIDERKIMMQWWADFLDEEVQKITLSRTQ